MEFISKDKNEPDWMLAHRLRAFDHFNNMPMPTWGPDLSVLNFDEICFFAKAADKKGGFDSWEEVPQEIKYTFERLGIPYQFLGPGQLYHQPEIKDLIAFLRVLFDPYDDVSLYRLLTMDFWKIDFRDIALLISQARRNNLPLIKLCAEKGIRIFVGSENDVLDRYYQVAKLLIRKPLHHVRYK